MVDTNQAYSFRIIAVSAKFKEWYFIKKYLPYLSWLKKLKRKIGIEDVEYSINTDILNVIENVFQEQNLEYSIFEGTPCVHKKTTIQIFKNKKILGYCKVSQNPKLYEIFRHEQELLEWLNKKGVLQIPTCLFCGEIGNDFVFLQTTVKTIKSHVRHELGYKQLDFLEMLTEKTYQKMFYHDTNQYQTVCILQEKLDLLNSDQQRIIKEAIEFIEKYYAVFHICFLLVMQILLRGICLRKLGKYLFLILNMGAIPICHI